jgi:hypothetical protein
MTVELEFIEGSRSEAKRYDVPELPANPDEDKHYQ